jgi:hypothetical protein
MLLRARDDADMLQGLKRQIGWRAPRFTPEAEASALMRLVDELLERRRP